MKKVKLGLLVVMVLCLAVTGCGSSKEKNTAKDKDKKQDEEIVEPVLGGWNEYVIEKQVNIDEQQLEMFNKAIADFTNVKFDAVALLGTQVVSGTNYMFLAAKYENGEENNPVYEAVVIYKDLEGNVEVISTYGFDYENYTNTDIKDESEVLTGGWTVQSPGKLGMISDEHIQTIFDEVTASITDVTFNPIDAIGYQVVNGTNYAIVCYGKTTSETPKEGIYVVTIYEDLDGNAKLLSTAYLDLKKFVNN